MYYQNYEDYMKSVLGNNNQAQYVNNPRQIYPYNYCVPTYTQPVENFADNNTNQVQAIMQPEAVPANTTNVSNDVARIRKMYPDIYVILNPMVEKTVSENSGKEITEEVLEAMTNKIYDAVEEDMSASPRQVSTNPVASDNKNRTANQTAQVTTTNLTRTAARRPGNPTLRDLIKILIINRLLDNWRWNNRPGGVGNRPPRPPERPDMRPPMPPPLMPRMSYPTMSYFSTPYPEDEYYIS